MKPANDNSKADYAAEINRLIWTHNLSREQAERLDKDLMHLLVILEEPNDAS